MSTIKGAEYPLYKVLSSDFECHIPDYQRPYAWTCEQASELYEDISGFLSSEGDAEKYFFGSIVLVKSYVQTPGGFEDLLALDLGKLSEPRRNMVENARHFAERLGELPVNAVGELGQFIVNNCYMVDDLKGVVVRCR
ncbi:MAG: DUF262 domain-containing protein [Gammaproteobacteria bacterium]|jgi:hypothetical protein|nr:DUF262 domain-containing protein [Gammaproteobacteria bacterium]